MTNPPADTTMMGVVHDALRRDLARLHRALTAASPPADKRRQSLAVHTEWMMDFLDHHHHTEDAGLWPLVSQRNPRVGPALDDMKADHAQIAATVAVVRQATRRYRRDASHEARTAIVSALGHLNGPLLAHLRREEDEVMPLVSASLTANEWQTWDKTNNVQGKSLSRLAAEGHWLMDGLDPDRYDTLVHLVPAPVRMVIVKGYARRYRSACAVRWGPEVDVAPLKPVGIRGG